MVKTGRPMTKTGRCLLATALLCLAGTEGKAVILYSTGTTTANTTAPGGLFADSGWQFQGEWLNNFTGTPISPNCFITAVHVGGNIGSIFTFQGQDYTTDDWADIPGTDLRIWRVTGTFSTYAPLYTKTDELGKTLTMFGRGTQRSSAITRPSNGQQIGWGWGGSDGVLRWGTNSVATVDSLYLTGNFSSAGTTFEATLSNGDSGGGIFIKDTDGVWKLAGINFAVDGPFKFSTGDTNSFNGAIYDATGLFAQDDQGAFVPVSGASSFYASRISVNAAAIQEITGVPEPGASAFLVAGLCALSGLRARRRRGCRR